MIEKVYEIAVGVSASVKYGAYENEETETLTGLMETRKARVGYLGGESPDPLIAVNVTVYSSGFIAGLNEALALQNALKSAGYIIYEDIESDYDKQIGKYVITFAICEN